MSDDWQVGERVIETHYGRPIRFLRVKRLTKTQVITGGRSGADRRWRRNGRAVGGDSWAMPRIEKAEGALLVQAEHQIAVSRLHNVDWRSLPTGVLMEVLRLVAAAQGAE